jgi:hypothetical protein
MDTDDPIDLSTHPKRLKSLNEFERPWWYPTLDFDNEQPRWVHWAFVLAGLTVGVVLGLLIVT